MEEEEARRRSREMIRVKIMSCGRGRGERRGNDIEGWCRE